MDGTETKVGHTPHPWVASQGTEDDPKRWCVIQDILGQPGFIITETHNGAPGDTLETEAANAHLMAAAPEMFSALQFAAKFIAMRQEKGDAFPSQIVDGINAAIAKATGSK